MCAGSAVCCKKKGFGDFSGKIAEALYRCTFVCYNVTMDRTVKTTLAAVLPIALFLLAIPVVLTVVLFVSCERSERERAEAEAQYQELLGGELAAVVREGSGIRSTDDGFSYSALLTSAADAARAAAAAAVAAAANKTENA